MCCVFRWMWLRLVVVWICSLERVFLKAMSGRRSSFSVGIWLFDWRASFLCSTKVSWIFFYFLTILEFTTGRVDLNVKKTVRRNRPSESTREYLAEICVKGVHVISKFAEFPFTMKHSDQFKETFSSSGMLWVMLICLNRKMNETFDCKNKSMLIYVKISSCWISYEEIFRGCCAHFYVIEFDLWVGSEGG